MEALEKLLATVQSARVRYQQEIAAEELLFDRRTSGSTPDELEENYSRWAAAHAQVMSALNEYQDAVDAYTEAMRRTLKS